MKKLTTLLCLAALTTSALSAQICLDRLTSTQVKNLVSGNTAQPVIDYVIFSTPQVFPNTFRIFYRKDGNLYGKWKTPYKKKYRDVHGKWWINDKGELCDRWDRVFSSTQGCAYMYNMGNSYVIINDKTELSAVFPKATFYRGNRLYSWTEIL